MTPTQGSPKINRSPRGAASERGAVIRARDAAWALTLALAALVSANVLVHTVFLVAGYDYQLGLRPFFDLNGERNAPAFYSGVLILANACVLALVSLRMRGVGETAWTGWALLALVFLTLSVDEVFSFHEKLGPLVDAVLDSPGGLLYFSWVLPGSAFALLVLMLSGSFLRSLDGVTLRLVIGAGAIYVVGAVGFEMLGGWRWHIIGQDRNDLIYMLLYLCEETLELAGMSLMLFALMRRAELMFGPLRAPFMKAFWPRFQAPRAATAD